jgi:hypothetical protein
MTKAHARDVIFNGLLPIVAPANFRRDRKAHGFTRPIAGGKQRIGVAFYDYNPRFEFAFPVTMRIEAVADIVNRFSGSPPAYHAITTTSITQMEHFGAPFNHRFVGNGEAGVAAAVADAASFLGERIVPFCDAVRDVDALNREMNPLGVESSPVQLIADRRDFDASNEPYRSMSGITLAAVARDPRFDALADRSLRWAAEFSPDDRQKFVDLLAFLRSYLQA